MVPVHGGLTSDRQVLTLSAAGPPEELQIIAAMAARFTPKITTFPGELQCALSWPVVVQCAFSFGPAWTPSPELSDWITTEAARRMQPPALAYPVPEGLTPYAHQNTGAAMIKATGRIMLADDPGTGKSATAILGLAEILCDNLMNGRESPEPVLIITPASVVDSWVQQVRTWAPHWRVTPYRGPRRGNLLGGFDVYVCSYEIAARDAPTGRRGPLSRLAPQSVVVDEHHFVKNSSTKRSQAVVRIARDAPYVVGLSGTPITHHTGDLTPMLEAMDHNAWPSGERFNERYLLTEPGDYKAKVVGLDPSTESEFRATLEGAMRRVNKADVLDLPPKVYSTRTVELPPAWRTAYDEFAEKMIAELPGGVELKVMDVFAVLAHLQSLACSAADARYETRLVLDEDEWSPTYGQELEKTSVHLDLREPSWKVDALMEVLEERPTSQTLVFAPRRQLLMLAGARAEKAGLRVGYIVGGQSAGQRTKTIAQFQAGETDVLMTSTQAGGVGITLTAASTVVFLQRPLSLVDATQAEDRAHRIGQTKSVEIIDILAKGTIDTRIREILREHAGQLAELVRDPRIVQELLGGHPAR